MDSGTLIRNIEKYCKERDTPPTRACASAGVGKSFLSNIKAGQFPSVAKVADLAAYLGVTTSDLIGDAQAGDAPIQAPDELSRRLGETWDALDAEDRAQVVGFARGLAASEKYVKKDAGRADSAG